MTHKNINPEMMKILGSSFRSSIKYVMIAKQNLWPYCKDSHIHFVFCKNPMAGNWEVMMTNRFTCGTSQRYIERKLGMKFVPLEFNNLFIEVTSCCTRDGILSTYSKPPYLMGTNFGPFFFHFVLTMRESSIRITKISLPYIASLMCF